MSKTEKQLVRKFKRDQDITVCVEWVSVEEIICENNRGQVRRQHLAVDDGIVWGCVKGFIPLKPGYDCIAVKLKWTGNNYYDSMVQGLNDLRACL